MDTSELEEVLSNLDPSSGSQGASPSSFEEVTDESVAALAAAPLSGAPPTNLQVATQPHQNNQGGPLLSNDDNRSDQPALLNRVRSRRVGRRRASPHRKLSEMRNKIKNKEPTPTSHKFRNQGSHRHLDWQFLACVHVKSNRAMRCF